jgi:hypothetical protein
MPIACSIFHSGRGYMVSREPATEERKVTFRLTTPLIGRQLSVRRGPLPRRYKHCESYGRLKDNSESLIHRGLLVSCSYASRGKRKKYDQKSHERGPIFPLKSGLVRLDAANPNRPPGRSGSEIETIGGRNLVCDAFGVRTMEPSHENKFLFFSQTDSSSCSNIRCFTHK